MKKLTLSSVIEALRWRDAFILQQHSKSGEDEFYVLPGGMPLPTAMAYAIISRSDIVAGNDGLIQNHPQTWTFAKKDIA